MATEIGYKIVAPDWGMRLRRSRKAKGMTMQLIAWRLGMHKDAVRKIEDGRDKPPLKRIRRMSKVYGIPIIWFLDQVRAIDVEKRRPQWQKTFSSRSRSPATKLGG